MKYFQTWQYCFATLCTKQLKQIGETIDLIAELMSRSQVQWRTFMHLLHWRHTTKYVAKRTSSKYTLTKLSLYSGYWIKFAPILLFYLKLLLPMGDKCHSHPHIMQGVWFSKCIAWLDIPVCINFAILLTIVTPYGRYHHEHPHIVSSWLLNGIRVHTYVAILLIIVTPYAMYHLHIHTYCGSQGVQLSRGTPLVWLHL